MELFLVEAALLERQLAHGLKKPLTFGHMGLGTVCVWDGVISSTFEFTISAHCFGAEYSNGSLHGSEDTSEGQCAMDPLLPRQRPAVNILL